MNPKHLSVRMDRETGDLWLTEEKFRKPIRKVCNLTNHVYLALTADLTEVNGTSEVTRDIKFQDGFHARITVSMISDSTPVSAAA